MSDTMYRSHTDRQSFGLEFASAPIYPQTVVSDRPNLSLEMPAIAEEAIGKDQLCAANVDDGALQRNMIRFGRPMAMGGLAGAVFAGLVASGVPFGFDIRLAGLVIGALIGVLLSFTR